VTIDTPHTDSAIVAIRDNNKTIDDRQCQCDHRRNESPVDTTGTTTGVDFLTDSVIMTIGTNKAINLPDVGL
jgi:hypothetical protein